MTSHRFIPANISNATEYEVEVQSPPLNARDEPEQPKSKDRVFETDNEEESEDKKNEDDLLLEKGYQDYLKEVEQKKKKTPKKRKTKASEDTEEKTSPPKKRTPSSKSPSPSLATTAVPKASASASAAPAVPKPSLIPSHALWKGQKNLQLVRYYARVFPSLLKRPVPEITSPDAFKFLNECLKPADALERYGPDTLKAFLKFIEKYPLPPEEDDNPATSFQLPQ